MATAGGSALPVMTYADRVKEEKRSQMWAAVGAGFAAAANSMNAANAGYSSTYGNYSGTATARAYGSGGYASALQIRTEIFRQKLTTSTAAYLAQQSANAQTKLFSSGSRRTLSSRSAVWKRARSKQTRSRQGNGAR